MPDRSRQDLEGDLLRRRLGAQLLAGARAGTPLAACRRLLAIQGQDPRGFRLAIRARTRASSVASLERALSTERSLVVCTLNRGTLHLVAADDLPWLHALTTPQLARGNDTRLHQLGVSEAQADRAVDRIGRWLGADGPLSRGELRQRLRRADLPVAGQAFIHLVFRASLRGVAVRGPTVGRDQRLVLWEDWLGPRPTVDRDRALAELGRRYLAGHGPGADHDLARWAGIPLRDARSALSRISSELSERPDGLLVLSSGAARRPPRLPAPQLLGAFEPVLLGWASRAFVVGEHEPALVAGGIFRGFGLVRGRARARWRLRGSRVELDTLEPLTDSELESLRRDGARLVRFLGLPD